jgi:hypothetical protein
VFLSNTTQAATPATLHTAGGWVIDYPNGTGSGPNLGTLPASQRIETLAEEGGPTVVTDNTGKINHGLGIGGCSTLVGGRAGHRAATGGIVTLFGLLAIAWAFGVRRRA